MDWSGLPDQGTAAPSIDFSGLPDQAPQSPANAPDTPDLASFGAQAAQYAPDGLTPENEIGLEQQFSQEHPYIYGVAQGITGMVPKSLDDLKRMATLPMPSHDVEQEQAANAQLGAQWRGEYGPTEQAASITGTALQALPLLGLASARSPFRATPSDAALVEQFRQAQSAEKPPVQPEAPPVWASDPVVAAPAESLKSETAAVDLSKLPDQEQQGTVRLYHGSSSGDVVGGDFTPSLDYAQGYSERTGSGGKVYYVDVPEDAPFLRRDEGADNRLINRQPVPDEYRQQAKPLQPDQVTDSPGDTGAEPETITHAAIKYPDGTLETSHIHALLGGGEAPPYGTLSGFKTNTGRFVGPAEAREIAIKAKQRIGDTGSKPVPQENLQPEQPSVTIPPEDAKYAGTSPEFQARNAKAGQSDAPPVQSASVGPPGADRTGVPERPGSGTSRRAQAETFGEGVIPAGEGVDTTQLLDNARANIRSGATDPYSILSRTRAKGIANAEEYATLAAEHERLVNDAVAKQKANAPDAPQAARAAEDFANAIQPHKTAASDLMRLFQGDVNYDMSTPFGMDQYMKSEIGRTPTMAERPKFNRMSNDIGRAQTEVQQAVARSDARVQSRYAKVRDIPMEEAASRVREWLKDCIV